MTSLPDRSGSDDELLYVVEPGPCPPDDWVVVHKSSGRWIARFLGCLEATEQAEYWTEKAHRDAELLLAGEVPR
jgi:hypothetical protein